VRKNKNRQFRGLDPDFLDELMEGDAKIIIIERGHNAKKIDIC